MRARCSLKLVTSVLPGTHPRVFSTEAGECRALAGGGRIDDLEVPEEQDQRMPQADSKAFMSFPQATDPERGYPLIEMVSSTYPTSTLP